MQISKDTVALFNYRLRDEAGAEIESSYDSQAMAYLHGHNNIIKGLEKAMEGKSVGDVFSVTVAPEDGYGKRLPESVQRVPVKHLHGNKKQLSRLKAGDVVTINTEQGARQATVVKAGKFNVDVDTNHPLAGQTLTFDVTIEDIREATAEEISHGHAHGIGGHQH